MKNEELAATWEKRAESLRNQADGLSGESILDGQGRRLRAKAEQLEADAAELLRNTPNVGHDDCVPSSGYNVDQHTHEGQTGMWLFPSEAPETIKAADGKTDLRRFDVRGVIYAPDRAQAQRRLGACDIHLDSAEIVDAPTRSVEQIRRDMEAGHHG